MARPVVTVLAVGNGQSSATISPTPNSLLLFGCSQREAATSTPDITIGVTGLTGLTWTEVTIGGSNTSTSLFMAVVGPSGAGTGTIQYTCTGTPSRPHYVCAEVTGLLVLAIPTNTHKISVSNNAAPGATMPVAPGANSCVVAILSALGTSSVPTPNIGFTIVGSGSGTTGFQMVKTATGSSPAALVDWTAGGATASGNQMIVVELVGAGVIPILRGTGSGTTSAAVTFTPDIGDTVVWFAGARKNGSSPAAFVITDSTGYDWTANPGTVEGQATNNVADPDVRTTVRQRVGPDPPVSMTITVASSDAAGVSLAVMTVPGGLWGHFGNDSNNASGDPSPVISSALTGGIAVGGAYGIGSTALTLTSGYVSILDANVGTGRMALCYHLTPSSTLLDFTSTLTNTWGWVAEFAAQTGLIAISADDTLNVGTTDASRTIAAALARVDSLILALTEARTLSPSAFTRVDGLNVGIAEVRTLKGFHARTDGLAVGVSDTLTLKSILARTDALLAGISEARTQKALLARVDALNVGTSEARALKALFSRSDALALAISEGVPGLFIDFGQILKAVSDTLTVGTTEAQVLKAILVRSDTLVASIGEVRALKFLFALSDILNTGTAEARVLKSFLSRSEALNVGFGGAGIDYGWSANSAVLPAGFTLTRASEASYWSGGVLTFAAANQPRFEDLGAGKGLLLEGSFTNISQWSEDFTNVFWAGSGITVTPNVALAPDGQLTADEFAIAATMAYWHYTGAQSAFAGTRYVTSCFLKQGRTGAAARGRISSTNAVSAGTGAAAVADMTGQWQRLMTPSWVQQGGAMDAAMGSLDLNNGIDGTTFGNTLFWGNNLGQGEFHTSYVRTTSAAATRAADLISRAVTLPAGGFTEVIKFVATGLPASGVVVVEHFTGGANDLRIIIESGTLKLRTSFGMDVVIAAGIVANTEYRLAFTWSPTVRAASLNGATVVSSGSSAGIDATTQVLGSDLGGASHFHGHIAECNASATVWRAPASDEDLKSLSAGEVVGGGGVGEVSRMALLLTRGDNLGMGVAEARTLKSLLARADALGLRTIEAAVAMEIGRRPGEAVGVGLIEQARVAVVHNRSDTVGIGLVESATVVKNNATGSDRPWWTNVEGIRPGMDTAVEPELGTV